MVRNYKRKTSDRWTKADLLDALLKIRDQKFKINEAARHSGISRATLYRQYTRFVLAGSKPDVNQFRTCGGNPILNRLEEDILEKTIKDLRAQGYPVTSGDVKRICFEYCESNGIPTQFNEEKRMASDDWYYGFLKRHPDLKMPKPGSKGASAAGKIEGEAKAAKGVEAEPGCSIVITTKSAAGGGGDAVKEMIDALIAPNADGAAEDAGTADQGTGGASGSPGSSATTVTASSEETMEEDFDDDLEEEEEEDDMSDTSCGSEEEDMEEEGIGEEEEEEESVVVKEEHEDDDAAV